MLVPYSKKEGILYDIYNQLLVIINAHLGKFSFMKMVICFILIVSVCLFVNSLREKRGIRFIMLAAGYMTLIVTITILGRESGQYISSIDKLFLTYKLIIVNRLYYLLYDVFLNVVLFIPFGFIFRVKLLTAKTIEVAFLTSLLIEVVQLVTQCGIFEISDLISNTVGALIGIFVYYCVIYIKQIAGKLFALKRKGERR